jgi:aminoglycoside 2'-N-acetyltransferase I
MLAVLRTQSPGAAFLLRVRTFLDDAFDGDFTDDDWAHSLGGTHLWIEDGRIEDGRIADGRIADGRIADGRIADGRGLLCHASIVERTMTSSGLSLTVGFVEAVATRASERGKGFGKAVMLAVNEVIRQRYSLGVLSSGEPAFYQATGWELWRGPTFVATPGGAERTPDDDGGVMILRTARTPVLDLDGPIVCDWRSGDVW